MRDTRGHIGAKAAALAVAVLVAFPGVATARQMDAADAPTVSGPLEMRNDECRKQQEKAGGDIVARGKTCLRIFVYDPAAETDTERNYGIAWIQSNLNSSHGWCGAEVRSDIDLPADIRVESKAPANMDIRRRKTFTTLLGTTAGGTGSEEASVQQTQILYPKSIRTRVMEETNVYRLKWEGFRNEKLGFASGVEISWSVDDAPGGIAFLLTYSLKRGSC